MILVDKNLHTVLNKQRINPPIVWSCETENLVESTCLSPQ